MNRKTPHRARIALAPSLAAVAVLAACLPATPASAKTPEVRALAEGDLRFGKFMVFGSGTRTVSASGIVTDISIVDLEGSTPRPAHFTVSYDRGNESNHTLAIELEVVISGTPRIREGGVEARLSAFQTDLPGALRIAPGQAVRISIPNCRTRVCSRSFNIGARLDVTRHFGGASLSIPIPIDAAIISVERQRQ